MPDENPFPDHSLEADAWYEGWIAADDDQSDDDE
jgi:hypothetical protein